MNNEEIIKQALIELEDIKYLIAEDPFYRHYQKEINGRIVKKSVAKIDRRTGIPKYLMQQRIHFNPQKNPLTEE
jgi:hypothetical protein